MTVRAAHTRQRNHVATAATAARCSIEATARPESSKAFPVNPTPASQQDAFMRRLKELTHTLLIAIGAAALAALTFAVALIVSVQLFPQANGLWLLGVLAAGALLTQAMRSATRSRHQGTDPHERECECETSPYNPHRAA